MDLARRPAPRDLILAVILLCFAIAALFWKVPILGQVVLPADRVFQDPAFRDLAPSQYRVPQNGLLSDPVTAFYGWHDLAAESLQKRGRVPLWNPFEFAGQPLVANAQSALFYPPNWLLRWLSPARVTTIRQMVNLLFSGLFTFLLCRRLQVSGPGSTLAAIAFTLSGPLMVWLGSPHSNVLASLPFTMWSAEGVLGSRRTSRWLVLVAVGVALAALGGHPETAFHVGVVVGSYVLARVSLLDLRPHHKLRLLIGFALATVLGMTLAAIQLVPFAEFLSQSSTLAGGGRGMRGGSLLFSPEWLARFATSVTLLCPGFYGTPTAHSYWFPLEPTFNYSEQSLYFGTIPLALAVGGLFSRRSGRPARIMALLAVLCLGVAWRAPVLEVVNHLPLFSLVGNGRLIMQFAFLGAVLAGFGFDQLVPDLQSGQVRSGRVSHGAAFVLSLVIAVPVAMGLCKVVVYPLMASDGVELGWLRHVLFSVFSPGRVCTFMPAITATAAAAAGALAIIAGRGRILTPLVIVLTLAELLVLGSGYNPTIEESLIFPTTDWIEMLHLESAPFRVMSEEVFAANYGTAYRIAQIDAYDLPVFRTNSELYRAQGGTGRDYQQVWSPDWPLVDWMNIRYVITSHDLGAPRFTLVYERAQVRVYRNEHALPRAYVVHGIEVMEQDRDAIASLVDGHFDFEEVVLLSGHLPDEEAQEIRLAGELSHKSIVEFVTYGYDEAVLHVTNDAAGLLVMSDQFAPGWTAAVDGKKVEIHRANYAFRAVFLSPGDHTVEFRYEPLTWRIGAALSTLGLVVVAVVGIRTYVRRQCETVNLG